MDLSLTASDKKFVAAATLFLARHWRAADTRLLGQRGERVRGRYLAALAASGRLVGHWPRLHGGLNWTARERWLWEREAAWAQAPQPTVHGPDLLGSALLAHGSEAQQRRHLPAIADGTTLWCQAFGEDTGGLDLGRVTTYAKPTAVPGQAATASTTGWTLTGTKPWVLEVPAGDNVLPDTNWMYVLARIHSGSTTSTDAILVEATEGQTVTEAKFGVFMLDLASRGVMVTPNRMIGEEADRPDTSHHSVGSVTLAAVQVPPDALLGPIDSTATLALAIEQAEFAQPGVVARNEVLLGQLRNFVEGGEIDGGSLWRDDDYRTKLHELEVAMASLQALQARSLGAEPDFVAAASLLIASRSRHLSQQLADLQIEALGYFALPYASLASLDNEGPVGPEFSQPVLFGMLSNRAREAVLAPRDHLKNIIAKSVLGLSSATLL